MLCLLCASIPTSLQQGGSSHWACSPTLVHGLCVIPQVIRLAELLPIFDTSVLDSVLDRPGVLPQHDILGETLPTLFTTKLDSIIDRLWMWCLKCLEEEYVLPHSAHWCSTLASPWVFSTFPFLIFLCSIDYCNYYHSSSKHSCSNQVWMYFLS